MKTATTAASNSTALSEDAFALLQNVIGRNAGSLLVVIRSDVRRLHLPLMNLLAGLRQGVGATIARRLDEIGLGAQLRIG